MSNTIASKTYNLPLLERALAAMACEQSGKTFARLIRHLLVPFIALLIFLGLWSVGAKSVETSLGVLPGPGKVWEQTLTLYAEHQAERVQAAAMDPRRVL